MEFEILTSNLRDSLGQYAIQNCDKSPRRLRIDIGECLVEDSRVRVGVSNEEVTFRYEEHELKLVRKVLGAPITSYSSIHTSCIPDEMILIAPSSQVAQEVCKEALIQEEKLTKNNAFRLMVWDANNENWRRRCWVPGRSVTSLVLNSSLHKDLMEDIAKFNDPDNASWYAEMGVPYRRGYLFFGPPGTGKTSTISMLATKLNRSVHRINLVAPKLTDDSLSDAVSSVRPNSIIVMEDIDCLFGKLRDKKEDCCVTFSGVLNAVDGIGDAKGTLFVFTSNHPDRLDTAMRRKGRIDREFYFGNTCRQQTIDMFNKFYPGCEPECATRFADSVESKGGNFPPSTLQEHFVRNREQTALVASQFEEMEDAEDSAPSAMYS